MELWIPITVAAALGQTWRTAMQQKLRGLLSVNGAGFVRFVYGVPIAVPLQHSKRSPRTMTCSVFAVISTIVRRIGA